MSSSVDGVGASIDLDAGSPAPGRRTLRGLLQTAPWRAGTVLYAFLICLFGTGAWRVVSRSENWWQVAAGLGLLAGLVGLQMWFVRPGSAIRPLPVRVALLVAQAALVYLPLLAFAWWLGVPGILGASLLLLLRPRLGIPLSLTVVFSFGLVGLITAQPASTEPSGAWFAGIFDLVTTGMTVLALYALTWMTALIRTLDETRGELARLAVAEQRLSLARGLRDRLGVTLSAIAAGSDRARGRLRTVDAPPVDVLIALRDDARGALADIRRFADHPDPRDQPEHRTPDLPTITVRRAHGIVVATFLCFGVIILSDALIVLRDWTQVGLGVACQAVVVGVQLGYLIRPDTRRRRAVDLAALGVQGVAVTLPVAWYGGLWLLLPAFVVGNALLILRSVVAVPVAGAVLVAVGWIYATTNPLGIGPSAPPAIAAVLDVSGFMAWVLASVVIAYGLTRLARMATELHTVRRRLAVQAVTAEAKRFARDVHDLLGISLSAAALKAELAHRMVRIDRGRAETELAEIASLCRNAIGQVRSVGEDRHRFDLVEELRLARSLLTSAGIDATTRGPEIDIADPQAGVLAAVVREGVTNVLRHSSAEHCRVTVTTSTDRARVEIVNDGLPDAEQEPVDTDPAGGQGIGNLRQRLTDVGGDLEVGPTADHTYRLVAQMPLSCRLTPIRPRWRSGSHRPGSVR